jgi:hypothetical protein
MLSAHMHENQGKLVRDTKINGKICGLCAKVYSPPCTGRSLIPEMIPPPWYLG